ncbi:IclR family transcriptional regulator [Nocardia neocaledoniensis]|uniref:IclR family transcriptional regulator n=1 Tax=Nocardia neocaledoniensis TaxID=236511 RepID=UPI002454557A|nr:IclR family transcriptional regulator [Nocardia neocaledoniensis]
MRSQHTDLGPVSVVERISLILEAFHGTGPLTLVEVTRRTGLPRSSVHRLLEQLTATGWLERAEQTYELGVKAYEIGRTAYNQNRLVQHATPVMRRLAATVGLTVHLGTIDREDIIYLAGVPGRRSPSSDIATGSRVPALATGIGRAIVANLPEDRIAELLAAPQAGGAPMSATTRSHLLAELARVRDHGAAYDRQEFRAGISCVGVAIGPPDHYYGNRAAISVFGLAREMEPPAKLTGPLRIAAAEIWDRCVAAHLAPDYLNNWRSPVPGSPYS